MTASPDVSADGRRIATSTAPARTSAAASAAVTARNSSGTSGRRCAQIRAHFAGVAPGTYPKVSEVRVTTPGYR
ncbi:hypothetical protein GCM10009645_03760 [Mycolicibacterium poriferae]|uniref:Uncharacterized protein n=1 Tax=Mycolicibacterium poriferae TaxID=39694 RepID=A0A6N4VCH6_9MYCO|nr:hypothetical protein MPOR_23830 [Mycolicibacterium poriferae]